MITKSIGNDRPEACSELLTKAELAKRLKVTTRTIDSWRERGVITAYKILSQVRFDWNSVLAELEQRKGAA